MEVMESAVKLNETRRKAYDQDELVEEQREREMRNRMNKMFLRFTKDVEDKYNLEFDAPYRELGKHHLSRRGTENRSTEGKLWTLITSILSPREIALLFIARLCPYLFLMSCSPSYWFGDWFGAP